MRHKLLLFRLQARKFPPAAHPLIDQSTINLAIIFAESSSWLISQSSDFAETDKDQIIDFRLCISNSVTGIRYPEHWRDRWPKDIRHEEAGMTVARMGGFAWSSLEPRR
jgi:hypothetical protein